MTGLVHELMAAPAQARSEAPAPRDSKQTAFYAALIAALAQTRNMYLALGLERQERVGVYLEKRTVTITALFGASAGSVFVPEKSLLKIEQAGHILAGLQRAYSGDITQAS